MYFGFHVMLFSKIAFRSIWIQIVLDIIFDDIAPILIVYCRPSSSSSTIWELLSIDDFCSDEEVDDPIWFVAELLEVAGVTDIMFAVLNLEFNKLVPAG